MSHPTKPTPKKHCAYCGHQLHRKRFNGRLEDLSVFNRRRYCDSTCMGMGRRKQDATIGAYRKRAIVLRKATCERCGATEHLHCHHIDGNPTNNNPSNVQTLCASCHTQLHWENGKSIPRKHYNCVICGKPHVKLHRGMCEKHYQRWKKYGNPYLTKQKRGSHFVLVTVQD